MASQQFKSLHKNATNVADGEYIIVNSSDTLVVQVSGTSTNFTLSFYGSLDNETYFPISGTAMGNFSTFITSISTVGVGIEFDVSALLYFKAKLTSINNGNISVLANAISS